MQQEPGATLPLASVSLATVSEWQPSCSSAAFEETRSCERATDLELTQFHSRYSSPPAAITPRLGNKDQALSLRRRKKKSNVPDSHVWLTDCSTFTLPRGNVTVCLVLLLLMLLLCSTRRLESVSATVRMRLYGFPWVLFWPAFCLGGEFWGAPARDLLWIGCPRPFVKLVCIPGWSPWMLILVTILN